MSENNNEMDELGGPDKNEPKIEQPKVEETPAQVNTVGEQTTSEETPSQVNTVGEQTTSEETPAQVNTVKDQTSAEEQIPASTTTETPDAKDTKFYVEIDLETPDVPKVKFTGSNKIDKIDTSNWNTIELPSTPISGGKQTKKRKNAIRKTIHKKKPRNSTSKKHTSTKKRQPKVR